MELNEAKKILEEAYNFDMLVKWTRKVKALG